jgi:hypothetical protein
MLTAADIPEATRDSPELCRAFRAALVGLFDAHEIVVPVSPATVFEPHEIIEHREQALRLYDRDPRQAAYYACDTGVPNDKILAAYTLLFL